MYSEVFAVQLDEVYRALVGSDVLTVVVGKESFGDVVDGLHEGYDGELLFSIKSRSPASTTRDFNLS